MKPIFAANDVVRVDDRTQAGHVRTPWYIRGKTGRVIDVLRPFPDPEQLAEGRNGSPYRILYRVRFLQREVWPDYRGASHDTLVVDLYEHWLRTPGKPSEGEDSDAR